MLTGTAWDANSIEGQAIFGGEEFGSETGYGRARLISVEKVKKIAEMLDKQELKILSERFDAQKMAAVNKNRVVIAAIM